MIYKKENATNSAKRFRSTILNPIGNKIIKRHFYKYTQSKISLHYGVKLCKRRKKSIFKTKFNVDSSIYLKLKCVITQFSLTRRYKTFMCLVTYSNGSISCLPSFSGAYLSQILCVWTFLKNSKLQTMSKMMVGSTTLLGYLHITNCFFNIKMRSNVHSWFCKAGGTFCIISRIHENKGYCIIKLPSIKNVLLHENTHVMLGRNSNILIRGIWLSKAGINCKKGYRPNVRGVAKNPVDHPHGGRTKSNSPELTPWGKIAKFNK